MKRILYIARNELYSLYYSPIAWILMVLFLILTSSDYMGVTTFFLGCFERGGPDLMMMQDLTNNMTTNPMIGYFNGVIRNLYMFFPLISMGLISRETSSGTIKLLYSSPLRITEIVLGKFVAMICFTLTLLILLSFTLVALSFGVYHPDFNQLFFSLLGLFFVLSTYAAIGLFISSLTSYQIVAAIVTLGIFAFLGKIGDLWQDIDVLQSITYYMNISAKSSNLVQGLMNFRDIAYFLILISGFLLFTVIRIKSGTESISKVKKFSRYLAVIVVAFVIGYITNKPEVNAYYDSTRDKIHTITPPTQAMLAKLNDGPVELTIYCNLLDGGFGRFTPNQKNGLVTFLWEPYIRFKPNIHINWVYYYGIDTGDWHYKINPGKTLKEIAEREAKSYGLNVKRFLTPEEVSKQVDIKKEEFRCFYQLVYKDKKAIVRNFDDNDYFPKEDEIAATINRLIAVPPKVVFLNDEIERGPFSERTRDYRMMASQVGFRYSLLNQGYDFDTLSLATHTIPLDIAALVIADPRTAIRPEYVAKINDYINAGGNMFLTSEPDRTEMIKPVFDKLGLSLRKGLLLQPNEKFSSDCVFGHITDTAVHIAPQFARLISDDLKYYGDSVFRVALGGASVMEYQAKDGFHIDPLLYTEPVVSWNRLAPISSDSLNLKVKKLPTDEEGRFVMAVKMHRQINGRDQRIIATSDADYLTGPLQQGYSPKRYNFNYGFWCFSYFSYGQFPANTLRPESIDDKFKIKVEDLPYQEMMLYYIIPALIAILGSIILIRRKRK